MGFVTFSKSEQVPHAQWSQFYIRLFHVATKYIDQESFILPDLHPIVWSVHRRFASCIDRGPNLIGLDFYRKSSLEHWRIWGRSTSLEAFQARIEDVCTGSPLQAYQRFRFHRNGSKSTNRTTIRFSKESEPPQQRQRHQLVSNASLSMANHVPPKRA